MVVMSTTVKSQLTQNTEEMRQNISVQELAQNASHLLELGQNTSKLLDELLLDYDKRLRPGFGGG